MKLTRSQSLALSHVSRYARRRKKSAVQDLEEVLRMSNISCGMFGEAVARIKSHARVALHFHPDRPDEAMKTVAENLLAQGIYKNQFETRLSNGSVSAFPGGQRDRWEKKLFGGAYHLEGTTDSQRPKYGALDLMRYPDGPSPRFGSCFFLLSPAVSWRCTFTYLDSHQDPRERGTFEAFDDILAALMKDAFFRDFAIGENGLTPTRLVKHLLSDPGRPFAHPSGKEPSRNLNHYIEAQVHGDILLREDVDALVADPSFRDTPTGRVLEEICRRYAIDLYWHMGFVLMPGDVPSDFRGPAMPSLARRIARDDLLDAHTIGIAAMDLKRDPAAWRDRGSYEVVLQELKLMWHVLVKYGKPFTPRSL